MAAPIPTLPSLVTFNPTGWLNAVECTFIEPLKIWVSSEELPNCVDPDSNIIEDETNSV